MYFNNFNDTSKVEIFIFDLEFVGNVDDLNTCFTWDLAAINWDSKMTFQSYILLPINNIPPPHPGCKNVTKNFLIENKARSFKNVIVDFLQWVATQIVVKNKHSAVLISHNCFNSDKPLLELEFTRYGIQAPNNIFFLDSLHLFRKKMTNLNSYSLKDLYQSTYNRPIYNAHSALSDVMALDKLFDTLWWMNINIEGMIYPLYQTSLRVITGVGEATERIIVFQGITCLEHLIFESKPYLTQDNSFQKLCNFLIHRLNISYPLSCRIANGMFLRNK